MMTSDLTSNKIQHIGKKVMNKDYRSGKVRGLINLYSS